MLMTKSGIARGGQIERRIRERMFEKQKQKRRIRSEG